jgi:MFS family permease
MSAQHEPTTPDVTADPAAAGAPASAARPRPRSTEASDGDRFGWVPARLAGALPFRDWQLPHALQTGPFRRYWTSQLISLAGTWMQNTGSQLVVLSLTSSAVLIGAVNVVSALPLLVFSLYGGVIADRLDRRRILIVTQSIIGVISLVYAWLVWRDQVEYWHILVIATFAGFILAFELPAAQAFVSELVDRDDLPQALALNSASFNATRTVGPALAGVVIGVLGMAAAFLINAATLLAPIWVLIGLRRVVQPPARSGVRVSGLTSLKAGIHLIRTHDDLLGLVYLSSLFSFLVFPNLLVLMPLYVTESLGGSDSWVAIMISILGLGSLTGSIALLRGSRLEAAAGQRLRVAMAGLAVGLLWLSLAPNPWWAIPGIMVAGFSFTTGNTQIMTRLQQLAPDDMRGRVMSVNGLAFNGVMPFATLAIGGLSELIGQHIVIGACAVLVGIGSALLWRRYTWRAFVTPAVTGDAL